MSFEEQKYEYLLFLVLLGQLLYLQPLGLGKVWHILFIVNNRDLIDALCEAPFLETFLRCTEVLFHVFKSLKVLSGVYSEDIA